MRRPRILIADDHSLVAELCRDLLQSEFDVVGIVTNGRDLVRTDSELSPDVVIVDVGMPLLNGLEAARRIKANHPSTKILFLTMNSSSEVAAQAFLCGASGYVLKTCGATELAASLHAVLRGETYLSAGISQTEIDLALSQIEAEAHTEDPLTPRQREILQLLAEGHGMKEVAHILNVTSRTVAFHKYRIRAMLGISSDAELVKYALKTSITS